MCFPVNFAKFLRTLFLRNTSGGCLWTLFAVQTVKISNNNLFSKYDLQKKFLMESFTITRVFQWICETFQSSLSEPQKKEIEPW